MAALFCICFYETCSLSFTCPVTATQNLEDSTSLPRGTCARTGFPKFPSETGTSASPEAGIQKSEASHHQSSFGSTLSREQIETFEIGY